MAVQVLDSVTRNHELILSKQEKSLDVNVWDSF